jgi:hypothetical protein
MDERRVGYEWNIRIHSCKRTPHTLKDREDLNEGQCHPEICHWFTLKNNARIPVAHGRQSLRASVEKNSQYDVIPQKVWRPLPSHHKEVDSHEDHQK